MTTVVGVRLAVAGAAQPAAGPPAATTATTATTVIPAVPAGSPTSTPAPTATAAAPHRSATASRAPRRTETPGPTQTPDQATTAAPPPSGTSSPAPSVTNTGPPGCDPGDLRLGALGAAGNAGTALLAGGPVRFSMTLTSTATRSCVVLPVVDLVVTSGRDRVWTSADCPVAAVGGPGVTAAPTLSGTARALLVPGGALLDPGTSVSLDLVWPGVRSAGSCTAVATPLAAGTYVAAVEVPGTGTVEEAFTLH